MGLMNYASECAGHQAAEGKQQQRGHKKERIVCVCGDIQLLPASESVSAVCLHWFHEECINGAEKCMSQL